MGFGAMSLAGLLEQSFGSPAEPAVNLSPLAPKAPMFPGNAKRVIHIFSQGGPSHIDTSDPKPGIEKFIDKDVKEIGGIPLPTQFKFKKTGQSGIEVSEIFPHIGESIDDIAVIRSMSTNVPAHDFATLMMNTGSGRLMKPSMGSWVIYGLGAENENLPGFIALGEGLGGAPNWRSAFLPGAFQGTLVGTVSGPVDKIIENIRSHYATRGQQRRQLDLLKKMNNMHAELRGGYRQAGGRAAQGSQTARHAGRYASRLGRRVWPHATSRQRLAGRAGARSSPRVFLVGCRRRHQGRAGLWRDG